MVLLGTCVVGRGCVHAAYVCAWDLLAGVHVPYESAEWGLLCSVCLFGRLTVSTTHPYVDVQPVVLVCGGVYANGWTGCVLL